MGIAERIGGWSTRHARLAALIWVAFVVAAIGGGSLVAQRTLTDSQQADDETARAEQIIDSAGFPQSGVGYLLKDRVADVSDFLAALEQVAAGGTVLDPEVVSQLLVRRRASPLEELTGREREVLGLMAQGRTNSAIASTLVITDGAVEKHIRNIFAKLGLPQTDADPARAGGAHPSRRELTAGPGYKEARGGIRGPPLPPPGTRGAGRARP
jgi:DNA-binding CsgD family transcriptional regulator